MALIETQYYFRQFFFGARNSGTPDAGGQVKPKLKVFE